MLRIGILKSASLRVASPESSRRVSSNLQNWLDNRRIAMFALMCAFLTSMASATPTTYYLASASGGGSDDNSGLTQSAPWLTPNHNINCGDVISTAAATDYSSSNFNMGKWGTVNASSCGTGSGQSVVAWLKCATFDACKITSGNGMLVDQSYWGVQGWEVTSTQAYAPCFAATPNNTRQAEIHHIVFANNVANGCMASGFASYNFSNNGQKGYISTASVDYIAIVGNIAYNAAKDNTHCYSGINIYQPIASDSNSGLHIYVAGNFSYGNKNPDPCNGTAPTDGNGIIFDTFDGSQGLATAYDQEAAVDNNITVWNGGRGIQIENNGGSGRMSPNSRIVVSLNTSVNNDTDTNQATALCSEIQITTGLNINEYSNLAVGAGAKACDNEYLYQFFVYQGSNSGQADTVGGNFAYNPTGYNYFGSNPAFTYGSNAVGPPSLPSGSNTAPTAPYCTGSANVPGCMSAMIANFKPADSTAKYYGYQLPPNPNGNPFFPNWTCHANLPPGLITTSGC